MSIQVKIAFASDKSDNSLCIIIAETNRRAASAKTPVVEIDRGSRPVQIQLLHFIV
jgi:hypothetical protein